MSSATLDLTFGYRRYTLTRNWARTNMGLLLTGTFTTAEALQDCVGELDDIATLCLRKVTRAEEYSEETSLKWRQLYVEVQTCIDSFGFALDSFFGGQDVG